MFRDFRYACRILRKSPMAAAVMVIALALGIGANAAMFVSVNALLLHPFAYPNIDRIVTVWETLPRLRLTRWRNSPRQFRRFSAAKSFFRATRGLQRTREIGIRIALGAAAQEILRMTLGQACRIAGLGLIIGVPAAYLLMRVLASKLYNVVVVNWTTFSGVTFLLMAAAMLAGYLPARRAAKIDPVTTLRND
jgi:hypothetical protein